MKKLSTLVYEMHDYWIRDRRRGETLQQFGLRRYPSLIGKIDWDKISNYFAKKYNL